MRALRWIRAMAARCFCARRRPEKWDAASLVPELTVKPLEARRVLNADAAPVEVLVVDAGENANDGQADTIQIEYDSGDVRVLVNGDQKHSQQAADLSKIHVAGSADDDVLVADLIAGVEVLFEAGGGEDAVHVNSGASYDSVAYEFDGDEAAITATNAGEAAVLRLRGVETVDDATQAVERGFSTSRVAHEVSLGETDDGRLQVVADGGSRIVVNFSDPAETLRVDTASSDADASDHVTLGDFSGGPHADLLIDGSPIDSLELGGEVELTGGDLVAATGSIVLNGSVSTDAADIRLSATDSVAVESGASVWNHGGAVDLGAPDLRISGQIAAHGGTVYADSGDQGSTTVDGAIDVSRADAGGIGGDVRLLGGTVSLLSGAEINASGVAGGGVVLVGGALAGADPAVRNARHTVVEQNAKVRADALTAGSGGRVVVWADQSTRFYGEISARGGSQSGDGGFAEVSGKEALRYRGVSDLRAPSGETGTLLLDPKNLRITAAGASVLANNDTFGENPALDAEVDVVDVVAALTLADLVLQVNNDLTIETDLVVAAGSNDLTLQAGRHVILASMPDTATPTDSTGAVSVMLDGNLTVTYNDAGAIAAQRDAGDAEFFMAAGSSIETDGGSVLIQAGAFVGGLEGATLESITSAGGDVKIDAPTISINSAINTGAGDLGLVSAGAVTQAAPITGTGLLLMGAGPFTLTNTNNDFATLAAGTTGPITYTDANDLEVGVVDVQGMSATGVETTNDDVSLRLVAADSTLTIPDNLGVDGVSTAGGDVTLTADNLALGVAAADSAVNAGAGTVTAQPEAADRPINLGTEVAGSLSLTDAELDEVVAADLKVGSSTAGTITVSAALTPANITDLLLVTGGDLDQAAGATVTVEGLGLMVTGATSLGEMNDVDRLAADTDGTLLFTNADGFAVDQVTAPGMTLTGVTAMDANTTLNSVAGALVINEDITSTTGNIDLNADAITQSANISTGGAGTIALTTDTAAIAMADGTSTTAAGGQITYTAATSVELSRLQSNGGTLIVTANTGMISDITAAETANLIGAATTLAAATGVGVAGAGDIDTRVGSLRALNTMTGDIFIQEANGLTVNGPGVLTLMGDGDISIDVDAGDLVIESAVTADGAGNVTLNADAGTVDIDAAISSTTGNIDIDGDAVTQDANVTTGGAGLVSVDADVASITMGSAAVTTAAGGQITYTAQDGVALTRLVNTGSKVVTATTGAITDNLVAEAPNLSGGAATLTAFTGIGAAGGGDIDTSVDTVQATKNGAAGGIFIQEANTLVITGTGVRTLAGNGDISVEVTAGDLTIDSVVTASGAGDISLSALAGTTDVNATVSSTTGDISVAGSVLNTAAAVTSGGDVTLIGDMIELNSGASSISAGAAATLTVRAASNGRDFRIGSAAGADNATTLALDTIDIDALNEASGTIQFGADPARGETLIANGGALLTLGTNLAFFSEDLLFEAPGDGISAVTDLTLDATGRIGEMQMLPAPGDETVDLMATHLTIRSANGVGVEADRINTAIDTLEAVNDTSGGIFIQEQNGLVITDRDATDADEGVRTLGGNGEIDIDVDAGDFTIDAVVSANGSGDVTLNADAGTVAINDEVGSTTGAIDVDGLAVTQSGDVTTGGAGTIDVTAAAGSITMTGGATSMTVAGQITYLAQVNVDLGRLQNSGELDVTATTGAITDNTAGEGANLSGDNATLNASTGIGNAEDINTAIDTLQATNSTTGGIFIQETNTLTVAGTGVRTLAGDGDIGIDVDAGNLTIDAVVTADGAGDATLNADAGTLDLNDVVSSTTGNLDLDANAVTQDADIATGGAGTIAVDADTGSITMADGFAATTVDGQISYAAEANVAVSRLETTGAGDLAVTANTGAISDNTAAEGDNLVGNAAVLAASTGIGDGNDLDTSIASLEAANSTSGGIFVQESNTLTIVGAGVRTLGGDGDIGVDVDAGNFTIDAVVTADGAGDAALNADAGALDVNADVSSTTGNLDFDGDEVTQDANFDTGGAGTIDVDADTASITMTDGFAATSVNGQISYTAEVDVEVSRLEATGTGDLAVSAMTGEITDNTAGDALADINLIGNEATLTAATGIGAATGDLGQTPALDINVAAITATNTVSGTIQLFEMDGAALGEIDNQNRTVVLDSDGALTDGSDAAPNVTAGDAIVRAPGVGVGVNPIETSITRLEVDGEAGGVFVSNNAALEIADISGVIAGARAAANVEIETTAGDLVANQPVESTAQSVDLGAAQNLQLNQPVTGMENVSGTAAADVNVANTVTATNQSVSLDAGNNVQVDAAVSGGMNVSANATAGNVVTTAAVSALAESVQFTAGANVQIGGTVTGDENVTATASTGDVTTTAAVTATNQSVTFGADDNVQIDGAVMGGQGVSATATTGDVSNTQPVTAMAASVMLDAGNNVQIDGAVTGEENVNATAGAILRVGAPIMAMTQSVALDAGAEAVVDDNVTAAAGTIQIVVRVEDIDAFDFNAGLLTSSGGSVSPALFVVEITGVGPRYSALDPSKNLTVQPLTTGSTATIEAVITEVALVPSTVEVQVDWRESEGEIAGAELFPAMPDPVAVPTFPVGLTPEQLNARVIESMLDPAPAMLEGEFEHVYIANPDGADSPTIDVLVRVTALAPGLGPADDTTQIFFSDGNGPETNLLLFEQANGQIGITVVVTLDVLEFPVGDILPLPEALPVSAPVVTQVVTFAAPTPAPTVINIPAPPNTTPGVTTQAEERYYELRIVSFDESGNLVETPRERINLSNPKLEAIAPFNPSRLPDLFRRLPSDRYRIYLIEDGAERLMLDFVIERIGDEGSPIELPERTDASQVPPENLEEDPAELEAANEPKADQRNLLAPPPPAPIGGVERSSETANAVAPGAGSFVSAGGLVFAAAMMNKSSRDRRTAEADRRLAGFGRARRRRYENQTEPPFAKC